MGCQGVRCRRSAHPVGAWRQAPWHLYLAAPVSGAGWAMTSGAALNAMVSPWFARRRPAALRMAFNDASTGGVIFSPLWVALIAGLGYHAAAGLVAGAVIAVPWVLSGLYLGRTPAGMDPKSDGDVVPPQPTASMTVPRAADAVPLIKPWRDRRSLTLATAATFGLFAQIRLVAHLFSLLVPIMGSGRAGLTMS